MSTKLHDLSDLEYNKVNEILYQFSRDAVLGGFNDDYVYINAGGKKYRLDRKKVSPYIDAQEAVQYIKLFEGEKI